MASDQPDQLGSCIDGGTKNGDIMGHVGFRSESVSKYVLGRLKGQGSSQELRGTAADLFGVARGQESRLARA